MRHIAAAATLGGALLVPVVPAMAAVAAHSEPTKAEWTRERSKTSTPIQHFIFLMQGERSFDNYFGAYPGADGPPPSTCLPLVQGRPKSGCVKPFALHGNPAPPLAADRRVLINQINGGRMGGFVSAFQRQGRDGTVTMGHYDERDLGFYWEVARQYVLFDRFFSAAPYGIRLNRAHWVAAAAPPTLSQSALGADYGSLPTIFDRLDAAGISWKFYVERYRPRDTFRAISAKDPVSQTARVPLLNYARFVDDPRLRARIVDLEEYYHDLRNATLPAVAYVSSSGASERSARSIPAGQRLVRTMINELMSSDYWAHSAFLWSYDGAGGWYDHVAPTQFGGVPSGLRVPALLVSPYARRGEVNHTKLTYASALRFIEQNWNLAPLTAVDAEVASLASAFDFPAGPRRAELIRAAPPPPKPNAFDRMTIYVPYGVAALLALALLGVVAARRSASAGGPQRQAGSV